MRIDLYNDGSFEVDEHGVAAIEESGGGISYAPLQKYRGRDLKAAGQEDFLWETDKGTLIAPEDMATPHLVNAINMLWRNVFRIKEDRPEIMNEWAALYVDRACKELSAELQKRVENA